MALAAYDGSTGGPMNEASNPNALHAAIPFLHPPSDSMVPPFESEPSMKVFILPAAALVALGALPGCTSDSGAPAQPSFYTSMASESAAVDAAAAASMISGYGGNN